MKSDERFTSHMERILGGVPTPPGIPPVDPPGGGDGNSGEPPHNDGMEARLSALEEAVKGLPTKADFAELRADFSELRADLAKSQTDMHKAIADNHRWTHGALVGLAGLSVVGIIGMMATVWNASKPGAAPTPAAQQAPIIINVPAPAALPSPQPAPQQ